MAIALISNAKATASSTSTATAGGITTTGADLLIVIACCYSINAATTATVSDSKSNTWIHLSNYVNGNSNICIWYATNVGSKQGTLHTASLNPNGGGYPLIFFTAWSGAHLTAPLDQQSGDALAGDELEVDITPSEDNELVITGESDNDNTAKTINWAFSVTDSSTNNSFECGAWSYNVQTAATFNDPIWKTVGSSSAKSAAIASFKAPAAATGGGWLVDGALLSTGRGLVRAL